MEKIDLPELTLADIMRNIRAEVQHQPPSNSNATSASSALNLDFDKLTHYDKEKSFQLKNTYTVSDFCQYHDKVFIVNLFRAVLKREPDDQGMDYYLSHLRTGKKTKREIIANMRFSKEGRAKKVVVKGIKIPFLVALFYRVPVLGYLLKFVVALIKLPKLVEKVHQLEAQSQTPKPEFVALERYLQEVLSGKANREELNVKADRQELEAKADRSELALKANREELAVKADRQELDTKATREELALKASWQALEQKADREELDLKATREEVALKASWQALEQKADREELDLKATRAEVALKASWQALEQKVNREELALKADWTVFETQKNHTELALDKHQAELDELARQIRDHKLNILDNHRRLQLLLEEARKRMPDAFSVQQLKNIVSEEEHIADAMYIAFEDKFRGTREDIKKRQAVYLPYIKTALQATGNAAVLDVGCGRGEWLELLQQQGITASGLDLNSVMIQECHERGLTAQEKEVTAYLRTLPANSLAAITGFHLIEHLPFKVLLCLLDESLRVLKPGGMVIFETPNPENLMVGAYLFYTDPSHVNPLVPETTKFLIEQRGFENVQIKRLHKYSDYYPVLTTDPFLVNHFYNEMDFGVIGCKM